MNNQEIILFSLILSAIIMIFSHKIKNIIIKILLIKTNKRVLYIKKLIDTNEISLISIDYNEEPHRLKDTINHNGIIVDNILYNDKNSYFVEHNNNLYILGKKDNFCIELIRKKNDLC